jgi:hypothetical protein
MAARSSQDIYGYYREAAVNLEINIDQTPVLLPWLHTQDDFEPYIYNAIKADSEIRLIELLPPTRQDAPEVDFIRCRISTHTLASAPAYEAISHYWGTIHRHVPISVSARPDGSDDAALYVTPQLAMALRRLRLLSESRLLWCDQCCINQEDLSERGDQVLIMGQIFRKASRVVVWLGEDPAPPPSGKRDSELIIDVLKRVRDAKEDPASVLAVVRAMVTIVYPCYHWVTEQLLRWRAIAELFRRPWFSRTWVFQEVSLAKDVMFLYGSVPISFRDLHRLGIAIAHLERERGLEGLIDEMRGIASGTAGLEMMNLVEDARRDLQPQTDPSNPYDPYRLLCKLLAVLRRVRCTDSRDLIYAFLAFQSGEGITPNYFTTVPDVWLGATSSIIQSSQSLDILCAVPGDAVRAHNLPSWVPEYTRLFPYSRPIATPVTHFQASRGIPHQWIEHDDAVRLRVRGKIIDHVDTCFNPLWRIGWRDSIWLNLKWIVLEQDVRLWLVDRFHFKAPSTLSYKLNTHQLDLMRTLLADGAMAERQKLHNLHDLLTTMQRSDKAVESWYERHPIHRSPEEERLVASYRELQNLAYVAECKRVFFTEHAQLGMAAECIQEGDKVTILHGSRTPCILRPISKDQNEYRVISQCYLNGWMYGKGPIDIPHPHARWWEEEPEELILV